MKHTVDSLLVSKKTQNALKEEYIRESAKVFPRSAKMDSYLANAYALFVPFHDGILALEKPKIQKRFWFGENDRGTGDTGPGSMAYAIEQCRSVKQKDVFFYFNLRRLEELIRQWEEYDECEPMYIGPAYLNNPECKCLAIVGKRTKDCYPNHPIRMLRSEEAELVVEAYGKLKSDFEKRLDTYWNRYGAKHIHADTYWTER